MNLTKQVALLKRILATADLADCPEDVRASAQEAIAELGGCAFCGRAASG